MVDSEQIDTFTVYMVVRNIRASFFFRFAR